VALCVIGDSGVIVEDSTPSPDMAGYAFVRASGDAFHIPMTVQQAVGHSGLAFWGGRRYFEVIVDLEGVASERQR
jgi:hypothetical protein